jgi:formimidoylglutamate deiminase
MSEVRELPGFVNAHSHAFQRALRGRAEGADFWAWREAMLQAAASLDPDHVHASYQETYREMLDAGYTAVGEFHYVGADEAVAAVDAARDAGVEITLLAVAYARGGTERFRQESAGAYLEWVERLRGTGVRVGLAPHSVRACPLDWLTAIGEHAATEELVLHIHADEQPREIEECLAEHGLRPIELLERTGCLGPRTTIVHATHASDAELDLLAASGAGICVCPTTEANLGDGFFPVARAIAREIPLCIGSDSNVRIDPLEELRELEGTARRQELRRNVVSVEQLLAVGSANGARALGLESWPSIEVDLGHRSLADVPEDELAAALVLGCGADVVVGRS